MSIIGQKLLTTNKTIIDLSKFEAGIYFIAITTDKEKNVIRVLKQP